MSLRGPAGVLHDLIIDEAHRRSAASAQQFVLSTAARNESAQRLFARHGFRLTMLEMTRDR